MIHHNDPAEGGPSALQRTAIRALAAEFGPAIVWSAPTDDGSGTRLAWTDTRPTLALLVGVDGAISSPYNGAEEETWTREADDLDRPRVTIAARGMLAAVARQQAH
jgi:hypothetical protein